jgi:DNA-directed RNA polymerase subunit F
MTKDEILEMAEKVYGECDWHDSALAHLEQFAKLVSEHEREACANIVERNYSEIIADAIRARAIKEKNI